MKVAVEACAEDTKGQKCYICLEAVHSRTGEGLVRGCACGDRDDVSSPELGVAHVSCLAEQAKILVAEAEENKLKDEMNERWGRWDTCGLCEHQYHGVVRCALGWACWKTYLDQAEADAYKINAMTHLANGLSDAGCHEERLGVLKAQLTWSRTDERGLMTMKSNLAGCYERLGCHAEALAIRHIDEQ